MGDTRGMKRLAPRNLLLIATFLFAAGLTTSYVAAGGSSRDQVREKAASGAYSAFEAQLKAGKGSADDLYLWSVRLHESEKKTKTTLLAAQAHLARMRSLQTLVKGNVAVGIASSADEKGAAYYVAEAEVWVADAGGVP